MIYKTDSLTSMETSGNLWNGSWEASSFVLPSLFSDWRCPHNCLHLLFRGLPRMRPREVNVSQPALKILAMSIWEAITDDKDIGSIIICF